MPEASVSQGNALSWEWNDTDKRVSSYFTR